MCMVSIGFGCFPAPAEDAGASRPAGDDPRGGTSPCAARGALVNFRVDDASDGDGDGQGAGDGHGGGCPKVVTWDGTVVTWDGTLTCGDRR